MRPCQDACVLGPGDLSTLKWIGTDLERLREVTVKETGGEAQRGESPDSGQSGRVADERIHTQGGPGETRHNNQGARQG